MTYLTVPFFTFIFAVLPVWLPLLAVDLAALYVLLFMDRLNPRTTVFWVAIIFIVPFLGFAFYLLWGCTLFIKRDGSRKSVSDAPIMAADSDPVPGPDARLEGILRGSGADVYTSGNGAELLWSGREAIERLFADVEAAEESIHMESAAMIRGETGDRMTALLCEKASQGVDVRLLTSTLGFGRTRGLRRMREAGVRHATLHRRIHSMFSVSTKNRNFRNLGTIDGRIAYVGLGSFIRAEGPAAARAERRFQADWHHSTGEDPGDPAGVSRSDAGCGVQMVSSGPDSPTMPMLHGYSAIISEARERLYITFPYLVPADEMYNSIKQAVIAGTDVRILIPRKCRRWYQAWNSLAAANPLMEAGAHVFFVEKSMVKCMVVADGRVCTVGSGVYNSRSLWADYSENAVVYSEEVARQAEEAFESELEGAAECLPEEYGRRSMADRLKMTVARMLMYFNRSGWR